MPYDWTSGSESGQLKPISKRKCAIKDNERGYIRIAAFIFKLYIKLGVFYNEDNERGHIRNAAFIFKLYIKVDIFYNN